MLIVKLGPQPHAEHFKLVCVLVAMYEQEFCTLQVAGFKSAVSDLKLSNQGSVDIQL